MNYVRIVHGGRGSYIELTREQLNCTDINIPENQMWRLSPKWASKVFYIWHDIAGVKIYEQLKTVHYADYVVGMYYIDPKQVFFKGI